MHVETYGSGPRRCLAIHGWGGSHRDFAAIARHCPDDASLWAVDLPGYGLSPAPARWDLPAIVEDLSNVIAAVAGGDRAVVAGFCSGAVLALMAARRVPYRIGRIVLIDPFAFLPWYFRIFTLGAVGRSMYRMSFASRFGRRVATAILRRKQRTDDDFMGAFATVDHTASLMWLKLFQRVGHADRFADTALPVDIAVGERTFAAVRASVAEYRVLLPQARLVDLRNVGHLPLVRGARQISDLLFAPA